MPLPWNPFSPGTLACWKATRGPSRFQLKRVEFKRHPPSGNASLAGNPKDRACVFVLLFYNAFTGFVGLVHFTNQDGAITQESVLRYYVCVCVRVCSGGFQMQWLQFQTSAWQAMWRMHVNISVRQPAEKALPYLSPTCLGPPAGCPFSRTFFSCKGSLLKYRNKWAPLF